LTTDAIRIVEAQKAVAFSISNNAAKVATAWSIDVTFVHGDGTRDTLTLTEDMYQTVAARDGYSRWLAPGKSFQMSVPFSDAMRRAASDLAALLDRTAALAKEHSRRQQ
jgi:hypothetical protein